MIIFAIFAALLSMEVSSEAEIELGSYYPYRDARFVLFIPVTGGSGINANFLVDLKETNCDPITGEIQNPILERLGVEAKGACIDYASCLIKGKIIGVCRYATKACCLITTQGGLVSSPVSYFTSPDPPSDARLAIRRPSGYYCQVRLDFGPTVLEEPNNEGNCVYESLSITGHDGNDITICGTNTAQHMYLRFQSRTNIVINVVASSPSSEWLIKIEQILCLDSDRLAPDGCLQYYQGVGLPNALLSFNIPANADTVTPSTQQIANLDYNICFDDSYTGLVLAPGALINTSSGLYPERFDLYESLSISGNEEFFAIDEPLFDEACSGDFLGITNGIYGYARCKNVILGIPLEAVTGEANLFCGPTLPLFIYTTQKQIRVYTNNFESNDGDTNNQGFIIPFRRTNVTSLPTLPPLPSVSDILDFVQIFFPNAGLRDILQALNNFCDNNSPP